MMPSQLSQCKLGIPALDEQHFKLLEDLHALIAMVRDGQPYEHELELLKANLRTHFHNEDVLMGKMKYPYIAAHLRDHENLIKLLDRFASQVRIGTSLAYATMVVENIFADHIINFDTKYADYMRVRGIEYDA